MKNPSKKDNLFQIEEGENPHNSPYLIMKPFITGVDYTIREWMDVTRGVEPTPSRPMVLLLNNMGELGWLLSQPTRAKGPEPTTGFTYDSIVKDITDGHFPEPYPINAEKTEFILYVLVSNENRLIILYINLDQSPEALERFKDNFVFILYSLDTSATMDHLRNNPKWYKGIEEIMDNAFFTARENTMGEIIPMIEDINAGRSNGVQFEVVIPEPSEDSPLPDRLSFLEELFVLSLHGTLMDEYAKRFLKKSDGVKELIRNIKGKRAVTFAVSKGKDDSIDAFYDYALGTTPSMRIKGLVKTHMGITLSNEHDEEYVVYLMDRVESTHDDTGEEGRFLHVFYVNLSESYSAHPILFMGKIFLERALYAPYLHLEKDVERDLVVNGGDGLDKTIKLRGREQGKELFPIIKMYRTFNELNRK